MRQNLNNDLSLLKPGLGGLAQESSHRPQGRGSQKDSKSQERQRAPSNAHQNLLALPGQQMAPSPLLAPELGALSEQVDGNGLRPIQFDRLQAQQSEHRPFSQGRRQQAPAKQQSKAIDPKLLYRYVLYSPCDEILHRIAMILQQSPEIQNKRKDERRQPRASR